MKKLRLLVVEHLRFRGEAIQKWQGWKLKPRLFLLLGRGVGQNLRKPSEPSRKGKWSCSVMSDSLQPHGL